MPTGEVPSIKIVAPKAGEALSGQAIRVGVVVRGLVMDPEAIGKAKAPGRGHWHLYLDGAFVNATAVDQTTLETLPPGPHHLRVSLANNDHSSLSPPVEDNVVIDVR